MSNALAMRLSNVRRLMILGALAVCGVGLGVSVGAVVYGAESASGATVRDLEVPQWLWASLFAGVVQGLVWYGAINSKLTWLMGRVDTLEARFNRHAEHGHRRAGESAADG